MLREIRAQKEIQASGEKEHQEKKRIKIKRVSWGKCNRDNSISCSYSKK